MTPIEQRKRS